MDLTSIHNDYDGESIENFPAEPFLAVEKWMEQALKTEQEPTAFSLATHDLKGNISVRVVLAKEVTIEGVTFFTHGLSHKSREIQETKNAAGVFFWPASKRQLRFEGKVTAISAHDSDAYFHSRPHLSQVAGLVSRQSSVVASYQELNRRFENESHILKDKVVSRPKDWGGFTVAFDKIEFWQGKPNRLHQRLLYTKLEDGSYRREWLEP